MVPIPALRCIKVREHPTESADAFFAGSEGRGVLQGKYLLQRQCIPCVVVADEGRCAEQEGFDQGNDYPLPFLLGVYASGRLVI